MALLRKSNPANNEAGPRDPLAVWGTYAAIGVGCAALLVVYAMFAGRRRAPLVESMP